jgi:FkbM family methyltransferase
VDPLDLWRHVNFANCVESLGDAFPFLGSDDKVHDAVNALLRALAKAEEVGDDEYRPLLIDVGSHDGGFVSGLSLDSMDVHCFEPNPAAAARVVQSYPSVVLHPYAVSNANAAEVDFHVPLDPSRSELSSLSALADIAAETARIAVQVVRLDDYLPAHVSRPIDLLKVDVEGVDALVLDGAQGLFRHATLRPKAVLFEYSHVWTVAVDTGVHRLKDTVDRLSAHGYDTYALSDGELIPVSGSCWAPSFEWWWWSNLLALSQTLSPQVRAQTLQQYLVARTGRVSSAFTSQGLLI